MCVTCLPLKGPLHEAEILVVLCSLLCGAAGAVPGSGAPGEMGRIGRGNRAAGPPPPRPRGVLVLHGAPLALSGCVSACPLALLLSPVPASASSLAPMTGRSYAHPAFPRRDVALLRMPRFSFRISTLPALPGWSRPEPAASRLSGRLLLPSHVPALALCLSFAVVLSCAWLSRWRLCLASLQDPTWRAASLTY